MKKLYVLTGISSMLVILGLTVFFVPAIHQATRIFVTSATARLTPASSADFPSIQLSQLNSDQIQILTIAKKEYEARPVSYDSNVLKYTDGNKEAWCADFLSWVMKSAGHPYTNPHAGNWRIPGVLTLQEFYQSEKRYQSARGYQPQPGDIAFYIGRHTADLFSTSHVALVIAVDGNRMTTLGGNEGGRMRISTQTVKSGERSLVGFGTL